MAHQRGFLKLLFITFLITGCGWQRIDLMHPLVRSPVINSLDQEKQILAGAQLGWTEDGRVRVLYVRGTPYERGYQHGALLRREVQDNLNYLYKRAVGTFLSEEIFAEAFERMRPYISEEYMQEMHGLAHGAKIPLHVVHAIHALPEMGEWGGKKHIKEIVKQMMAGELGTSCSNLCVNHSASAEGKMYTVRILDWGLHRISKLHQYPLILVARPDKGIPYVNIGWVGFLGAISGMNEEGITLGEMGYGSPPNETLAGKPMPFLLRDILSHAHNLSDVRKTITTSPGTNSFVFLMSDGKAGEAELYIRDRDRFLVVKPGTELRDGDEFMPAIADTVYGGHFNAVMAQELSHNHGKVSPQLLMEAIIPKVVMASNFQNVIYSPSDLTFWVSNARSKSESAAAQPYTFFDFKKALQQTTP
jgi:isopenicillin-N N-acyltransferase-like protein